MNSLRFQFKAQLYNRDDWVQGYYIGPELVSPTSDLNQRYIRNNNHRIQVPNGNIYRIDLDTLQLVPVPIKFEFVDDNYTCYCPDCQILLDLHDEHYSYCKECGCRLDYTEVYKHSIEIEDESITVTDMSGTYAYEGRIPLAHREEYD